MLEILILINFHRRLGNIAQAKGRARSWGMLGVAGWVGGEILGFLLGALVTQDGLGSYLFALVCAALGATTAWFVVKNLRGLDEELAYAGPGNVVNANYDPSNPYSPPRVE